jgi:uncharacterized damage-inducible protein DinB
MKQLDDERKHLVNALAGKGAHIDFDSAIAHFPEQLRGKKTEHIPHTAWQLLEHMRIAQADILDFCQNSDYKELTWPDDYWPKDAAPPDNDGSGQTLFREALLVIDHNSYHLGQLVFVRQFLGAWPPKR